MSNRFCAPICPNSPEAKGYLYYCDHPLYNEATLFLLPSGKGLCVIQQRFNSSLKYTWWGRIDEKINIDISNSEKLEEYLEEHASYSNQGLYPTMEVRKMLWALKVHGPAKQFWETRFA